MWNNGRQYNRGAMIAGGMAGRNNPIMNKGASMADALYAYKDGKDWNAQEQKNDALKAAGTAYGSGDNEGFRKNMATADLGKLLQYDNMQEQMKSADAARREQMAQTLRMHNDDMSYKNSILQRQQIASKLKENDMTADAGLLESAQGGIEALSNIAQAGGIGKWSNKAGGWLTDENAIGERDAALSTLIPLTNKIAIDSGGSGINTLGEMMAYLGIPENSTSGAIAGALPLIAKKLGLQYTVPEPLEKSRGLGANLKNDFVGTGNNSKIPFGNSQYFNKYGLDQ